MCVDGAADMGKSSARTHGQGELHTCIITYYLEGPTDGDHV